MFRPCIDLHEGKVKQIVGGTLGEASPRTNFVAEKPARWFAELYQRDGLTGGHVVMLGPGNGGEACSALAAFPGGLQIGGGINSENARGWLEAGASHVIVTSWAFREGRVDWARLEELTKIVGKKRLVLDLSCRKRDAVAAACERAANQKESAALSRDAATRYFVVTNRWQKFTEVAITPENLRKLAGYCDEFLVHAVDVEGLRHGIDRELVKMLGDWTPIPATYAGGANSLADLEEVTQLGHGRVDLTIGSALDIFGGHGVRYTDAVAFNRRTREKNPS